MRNRRSKGSYFGLKIIFFLVVCLLFLSIFLVFFKFFSIDKINLKMADLECVEEKNINENVKLMGKNLYFLDISKIRSILKRNFLCIKDIKINKKFPNTLNLEVIAREKKYRIKKIDRQISATESSNLSNLIENYASESAKIFALPEDIFLVDDEGVVFSKKDNKDIYIPEIYFFTKKIQIGENIEKNMFGLNKIFTFLNSVNLLRSNIFLEKRWFFVENNGLKIIFDLDKNIDFQIASLQLILQKAKIENKEVDFIDLRFDKGVVKFNNKKE